LGGAVGLSYHSHTTTSRFLPGWIGIEVIGRLLESPIGLSLGFLDMKHVEVV
jgi:hypothetical protein